VTAAVYSVVAQRGAQGPGAASTLFAAVAIGHKTGRRVNADELVELVLNGLAT
jgi:hypothetical protein